MKQDLYALLGVPHDADAAAIIRAYEQRLASCRDNTQRSVLRQAQDVLTHPANRAAYDAKLAGRANPARATGGYSIAGTERKSAVSPGMVLGAVICLALAIAAWREFQKPVPVAKPKSNLQSITVRGQAAASVPAPAAELPKAGPVVPAPESVYALVAASVVVVEAVDATGRVVGSGSGVVIGPLQVLTNCHVVQRAVTVRVKSGKDEFNARSGTSDTYLDLCSLTTNGQPGPPVARSSARNLRVGQTVYAIGTPQGFERTLSQGLVSALRETTDGVLVQTSAAISPGSSGGGLFNDEGQLVGITTFQHKQGQNLNFALPSDWLDTMRTR